MIVKKKFWGKETQEIFNHNNPIDAAIEAFEDWKYENDEPLNDESTVELIEMEPMHIDAEQWAEDIRQYLFECWMDEYAHPDCIEPDFFTEKTKNKLKEAIEIAKSEFHVSMLQPTGNKQTVKWSEVK